MSAKMRATAILGVVLGILLTWTALASSSQAAPGYTEGASISLNASVAECAGNLTVSGTGFAADELVTVTLHTETVVLASVHADSSGAFSLTVDLPGDIDGQHTIVASGAAGEEATARVTIQNCQETEGGGTSNTGVAIMAIGGAGILLLGLGTLLVISARRRRSLV
jgi:hypothetical protein